MSWRDTIQQQSVDSWPFMGSYGAARFIAPRNQLTGGRRTQVHELPLRDDPIIQDFGPKAREFTIEVFVDGSIVSSGNYMDARDALLDELDQEGPKTLVHPWYGRMQVSQVQPYHVSEESANGGRATFTLSLIRDSGATQAPAQTVYTPTQTQAAATAAQAAAVTDFSNRWNVSGLPDFHLAELSTELDNTLSGIESTVSGITNAVAAEIRAPFNMGSAVIGGINKMADIIAVPLNALRLYTTLFDAGSDSPAIPTTTPVRIQEATSAAALHALVQRGAVTAAAMQSSQATYTSREQALSTRNTLLDALDAQMVATDPVTGVPIDDTVYQALEVLRAAVAEDLRTRGAQLPDVGSYTPQATAPAIVVAYRLYDDTSRDAEIVARNAIAHPGFVPGGQALEVLSV